MARPRLTDADTMTGITTPVKTAPAPAYNPLTGMVATPATIPTVQFAPGLSIPAPTTQTTPTVSFAPGLSVPTPSTQTSTSTGQYVPSSNPELDALRKQLADLQAQINAKATTQDTTRGQSAYDTLLNEFNQYGLGALIEPLKGLIQQNVDPASLRIALENTDAYKKRFAANQDRINAGLSALNPATYIGLEDQYQNLMRSYGLPASYYTKGDLGIQEGFNKLIANDVSATELEQRLIEAQQKVNQSSPEVKRALQQFYPGITNGDILAYSLDPKNALTDIKRKVAAAEIGGAALAQNLGTTAGSAEALAAAGITKAQAQQGYQTISSYLPAASTLSDIYGNQIAGPYNQAQAEADVFGTTGASEAQRLRKKLSQLEQAQFAGQAGTAQGGALSRDRVFTNYMLGTPGAGAF